MFLSHRWSLGGTATAEILRCAPEKEPTREQIEGFLDNIRPGPSLLPFRSAHYVWRTAAYTAAWLNTYIDYHVADLRSTFVGADKSFYLAFIEYCDTRDRAVSFRLTTAGLTGHTEWQVIVRRTALDGQDGFLCGE